MTDEKLTLVEQECLATWGEAGLAEMKAYCADNGMTLEHFLEAIAHRPGGVCDKHGIDVDAMPAEKIASVLRTSRIISDMQAATEALLLQPSDFFNSKGAYFG